MKQHQWESVKDVDPESLCNSLTVGPSRHLGGSEARRCWDGQFSKLEPLGSAQKSDEKRFQLTSKNGTWMYLGPEPTMVDPLMFVPPGFNGLDFLGMPLQAPGHGEP